MSGGEQREIRLSARRGKPHFAVVVAVTETVVLDVRSMCNAPTRSASRSPSAPQTAASTSDDASLRPRSISDRYGSETRA